MVDFGRVKRAVKDEIGLRDMFFTAAAAEQKMPRVYDLRAKGCWPQVPADHRLAYGYGEAEVRPGPASVGDVYAWDVAIELTKLLSVEDARLVWAAAHSAVRRDRGPAWRKIAAMMTPSVHPETARRRFNRAILGLWHQL
jgi:hypothetical protein